MVATRIVIIMNPAAGGGRAGSGREAVEQAIALAAARLPDSTPATWSIVETSGPGDGQRLAAQAAREGADVVAAAGGDGTLGEVVNGIAGSTVRLGLLPMGTGNDFARSVGLHGGMERAVHTLFHGRPRTIDLGRMGERWFINVAGCGFDAIVAQRVNRGYRWLRGTSAYLAAVAQSLAAFRPAAMRLTFDGETRELPAVLCAIANAPMYGGGMKVAPNAAIDDGLLDICIIGDTGRMEFLRAFPRVFAGTHTSHPKVTMLRAQIIRVESEPSLPVLVDGEIVGTTPAEFTIAPGALTMLLPE